MQISISGLCTHYMQLFELDGSSIMSRKGKGKVCYHIPGNKLGRGIHIIHVKTDNATVTKKIAIQ